jgi:hypothetical protein
MRFLYVNAYRFRGNVCLSADEKWLLVDNLAKGFDLYQYPRSSPSESFPIPREKAYVQEGIFLENETSIACGSDHGDIYIYSLGTTKCLQKLKHGGGKAAIQVLDVSCCKLWMVVYLTQQMIRLVQQVIDT